MEQEKDLLDIWKERIEKESKYGDKWTACRIVGCSRTSYITALERDSFSELTNKELEVLSKLIDILDERKASRESVKAAYLTKANV